MTQTATFEQLAIENLESYQFYPAATSTTAKLFGNSDLEQLLKTNYDKRITLQAHHFSKNKFENNRGDPYGYGYNRYDFYYSNRSNKPTDDELVQCPVVVFMKTVGFNNYDRKDHRFDKNNELAACVVRCGMLPYCGDLLWNVGGGNGSANFFVEFDISGRKVTMLTTFLMAKQLLGIKVNPNLTYGFDNGTCPITNAEQIINAGKKDRYRSRYSEDPEEKILALNVPSMLSNWYFADTLGDSIDNLFKGYFATKPMEEDPPLVGIKKTWEKMRPFLTDLRLQHPMHYLTLRSLCLGSKASIDTVKVSSVFNESFANIESMEDIYNAIQKAVEFVITCDEGDEEWRYRYRRFDWRELVKGLGSYKDKRKQAIKSNSSRAFAKLMEDYEYGRQIFDSQPWLQEGLKDYDKVIRVADAFCVKFAIPAV